MKITVKGPHNVVHNKKHFKPGEEIDVPKPVAESLLARDLAEEPIAEQPAAKEPKKPKSENGAALSAIIALMLLLWACMAGTARAQLYESVKVTPLISSTTNAVVLPTIVQTNFTTAIQLRKDRGLSLTALWATTNASGSNVIVSIATSANNSNYAPAAIVWTVPNAGTVGVPVWTNIPKTVLDNVNFIKVSVSNVHLSTLFITNIWLSNFN